MRGQQVTHVLCIRGARRGGWGRWPTGPTPCTSTCTRLPPQNLARAPPQRSPRRRSAPAPTPRAHHGHRPASLPLLLPNPVAVELVFGDGFDGDEDGVPGATRSRPTNSPTAPTAWPSASRIARSGWRRAVSTSPRASIARSASHSSWPAHWWSRARRPSRPARSNAPWRPRRTPCEPSTATRMRSCISTPFTIPWTSSPKPAGSKPRSAP